MEDSDDDIMILEEVNPHNMKSKKWKYKAPNPTLGSEDAQEVLKNVREKLNMQNPVMFGVKDKRNVINSRRNKLRLIKEPTKSKVQILEPCMVQEKTPKKSVPEQAPLLLSPKDILELTENCLDSDNEPCSNSVEKPQSQQHGLPISSGPRKALSFSAKTSCSVRFNASKFFGAGTSSAEVNEILSQENMSHLSPTKSPSSKKKRLSKHSPIRLLPSHRNLGKSPGKRSPGKRSPGKLGTEFHCPTKCNSGFWNQEISTLGISKLPNETETQTYDGEPIAEGPYYYEAFCFMIKKIYENLEHRHLFLETEIRKMSEVSTAKSEFQLYVRLMNRKDRWNRCSDISYEDIAKDLSPLFDFLEAHELISCNVSDMKLEGLLQLLKKDELKMVCDEFKVKKNGNKPNLVDALLSMHRSQPTLNGISPLSKRVKALLGRCVKLNMIWRLVFRRCILLFSMFHSYEDLDALCSEQALLLLQVKLKNVVYPLQEIKNYQGSRIFSHRDQLIRFEEASELRQDLNNAIKIKDFKIVSNLTERGMKQFSTLLELTSETDHVLQLPSFLQRYSAGSMYARTLSTACDALKQGQMHKLALDVLELLLSQSIYCLRLKGEWLLKQATIYHVNIKDVVSASKVLCSALSDKSLSSVDRMHLQQRAEKVYKLKKNGLTSEYKKCLEMVMDPPCKAPEVIEITARAMLGSKPGLKKVYIRDTGDGKEFMSVEEVVIAHYRSLGFLCGVHDEGSTVSSLCLLSLWNVIYSTSVPSAFLSPYQIKPLDWGSKAFYKSRKNEIDAHFSRLQTKSVDFVANELCDLRTKYCQFSSLVNWDRLERLDIHAFLNCLSLPVFLAISRRLVEDWRSHRSGFPDLVLWSSQKKESLFVEVKSPNDTLSTVQSMWLNFLRDCGAKAFVVLIREAGSKGMMTA